MCYVPDNLGERRRKESVSQTACEFFVKYCEHADKETGLTFANVKTCAEAFEMRIDNAQKYDKELIDKGWIRLVEENSRIYRKVEAGWLSLAERQGQGKAENTEQEKAENITSDDFLKFRNELENLLNFSESSYILGESPKFKELLLNFRKSYKEVLNQHLDQPTNQHTDQPLETASGGATDTESEIPVKTEKPKAVKKKEKPDVLSADFEVAEDLKVWAVTNAPNVDLTKATGEFITFWRDIATRSNRRTLVGWKATWRNRMTALQEKFEERNGGTNAITKQNTRPTDAGTRNAERINNTNAVIEELFRQGAVEQNLLGNGDAVN